VTGYVPLLELRRGGLVESVHFGAAAVVDTQGHLVAWVGDPDTVTFLRSTAKPLQALPFVEDGGVEAFGLTLAEVALICASHSGTDQHAATAASIQAKVGVSEADLLCGVHPPYDKATAEAMQARGEAPTPNRHNCSGKHSGMLAQARLHGWSIEDYINPLHPVQQRVIQVLGEVCDYPPQDIQLGIDGCSVPVFAMPLRQAALGFARLADPSRLLARRTQAFHTIAQAMLAHPEMVGGPGRFDTRLMEVGAGRMVCKGGAEAYQGVGLLPGACGSGSPALGIALKISDGDGRGRAGATVTLEILRQLGALSPDDLQALAAFGPTFPITNWRMLLVGEGRPCFHLTRTENPA
jgi:L-asparaginase II